MIIQKIGFESVTAFSNRDIKYQIDPFYFNEFYNFSPDLSGLKAAIKDRKNYPINRAELCNEITNQYKNIGFSVKQLEYLKSLTEENTFTVITAHQPTLFGGPLYYIYKIFSTINLAEKLSTDTDAKVIPIFINGSEDHDFEEVNHFNLFGKKLQWNNFEGGPIGRYSTKGIKELIEEITPILGKNQHAEKLIQILTSALDNSVTYNDFVFKFVNILFSEYGLIVVNMDNKPFKKIFAPIIKKEILNQESAEIIKQSQIELNKIGFSDQAFAREINLFYMQNGLRERIIKDGENFLVNNTDIKFTQEEMIAEIENNPHHFSPNVIMRPLFQESIFPNIAYVGGGGEIAYWLERKNQFKHYNVFFPTLIRRDSVMVISKSQNNTISKLGLEINDLFFSEDKIIAKYLQSTTGTELNVDEELKLINKAFDQLRDKAISVGITLEGLVEAERTKVIKQLDQIDSRIKRSLKQKEETALNQVKNIRLKLFPNNGLQERNDNFMQYYLLWGDQFFEILRKSLNPLDKNFVILIED
jgi:bacillithiol synthase